MQTKSTNRTDRPDNGIGRRGFLAAAVGGMLGSTSWGALKTATVPLGFDNFALRAFGWKAFDLLDYAAKLKVDSLFVSDLDALGGFEPAHLAKIKAAAKERGVGLHLGTWSICPTSTTFRKNWGSAQEHLALGLRAAAALGSPVLRVVLGNGADRGTPGGIDARIADTVAVCKSQRKLALDLGVKIAVENHAGDLQAWELARLVELAGKDYVGVNLDSGNSTWTLEDPLDALETLGPYAVTTSLRDSMIWETPNGASVQWTAMGDGVVDWPRYFKRFVELCPGVPVHIETISGFAREIPYRKPEFWKPWPHARAREFAAFQRLAAKGKAIPSFKRPDGAAGQTAERDYQTAEVERSLKYCREVCGLGLRK